MNVLGIDPGSSTGLAVVSLESGSVHYAKTVSAKNIDDVLNEITRLVEFWAEIVVLGVVVQTPIFQTGKTPRWNPSPVSLAKNAATSHEIIGFLKGLSLRYPLDIQIRQPTRGSGMKMDAEMFAKVYGYTGRTSEHARDAANLAMSWRKDGG